MNILFKKSGSQEIIGATNKSDGVSYNLVGTPAGAPKVAHGAVVQNSNGTYTYTPDPGFFGIESLSFANGQSMSLLVGPPTGTGLKDVAQGVQTIGTVISNVLFDGNSDPNSNLTNQNLEAVDSREFSHFTLENNAKWEQLGQKADIDGDGNKWEFKYFDSKLQELEDIAAQARELDSKVNLHTVLWNQPGNQPAHIEARYKQEIVNGNNGIVTDEFRAWFEGQIGAHVDTLLNTLGNTVDIIDVVNEHIFSDVKGNVGLYHKFYGKQTDYIKAAFTQTSAAIARYNNTHGPQEQIDARLAINDFNVLYRFDENKYDPNFKNEEIKADIYYNMINDLINDGVEIDVVSFQSHLVVDRINNHIGKNTDNDDLNDNVVPTGQEIYDAILSNLQRFIDLGVDIVISELDVRTHLNIVDNKDDTNNTNSDFNKIYEVIGALAHDIPEITDVVLWGTTHNTSWLRGFENDPLLFNNYYGREEEYYAFMEGLTGNSEYNRVKTGESNTNPDAKDDNGYTIAPGGSVTIDVLSNDNDRDGNTLTVTHINGAALNEFGWTNYLDGVGLIQRNVDGSLTQYALDTPAGTTGFDYTVSDGQGGSSTATATGSIGGAQNVNPLAVNDSGYTVIPGSSAILNVLANDSDDDADVLMVTHINGVELNRFGWTNYIPDVGMLKRNSDGSLTQYSLDAPSGPFTFEYTVSDGNGGTSTATVAGNIDRGYNANPVAINDVGYTIAPGQSAKLDVLGNDTDADGDLLTVTHINGAAFSDTGWTNYVSGVGIVQRNADGTLTQYAVDTPTGASSFEYTVSDGFGGTANATATGTIASAKIEPTPNVILPDPNAVANTSPSPSPSTNTSESTNSSTSAGTTASTSESTIPTTSTNAITTTSTSENASSGASTSPSVSPSESASADTNASASTGVSPSTGPNLSVTTSNAATTVGPTSQTSAQTNPSEIKYVAVQAPQRTTVEDKLLSAVATTGPVNKVVAQPKASEFVSFDSAASSLNVTHSVPIQQDLFDVQNSVFDQSELALADEFFI